MEVQLLWVWIERARARERERARARERERAWSHSMALGFLVVTPYPHTCSAMVGVPHRPLLPSLPTMAAGDARPNGVQIGGWSRTQRPLSTGAVVLLFDHFVPDNVL